MKVLLRRICLAVLMTAAAAHAASQIEYSVEKTGDLYSVLTATVNGKTHILIDESKKACLEVVDTRDWDGNGLTDALVKRITACGGNCCPDAFFFVSALPGGRFEISGDLADSWQDPVIEKWKGHWSAVIVSNNEGVNTERPVEYTRRFILRDGKGVKVEESLRKSMPALVEMRSEIFHKADEEHSIRFDLDGDGKPDVISGTLWERWGRILWSVRFGNGKEIKSDQACKRIGVLATKTGGVHDLVCDQDTVLRWTGEEYK